MLPAPATITDDYLASVRELEDQLRALRTTADADSLKLTKVLSIADAELAARSGPWLAALPVGGAFGKHASSHACVHTSVADQQLTQRADALAARHAAQS